MSSLRSAAIAILMLAPLTLAGAARADDWADAREDYTNTPAFAETKAICAKVRDRRPPRSDLPAPADLTALKGCDAEALYYGEGRPADPRRARLCAFAQSANGEADSDEMFAGRVILMMLYANGRGVSRDLDLAAHYACNLDGAPMENDGRVRHLLEMKAAGAAATPFDFCDDITSGYAMGHCSRRGQTQADIGRQAALDRLAKRVPPSAGPAFGALRKAGYAWADAHSSGEVDQTGTARAALVIDEEESTRDGFIKLLAKVLDGKVAAATPAQARAADTALNVAYRKVRARGEHVQEFGTVTFADVRGAQRAWLKYRDAVAAFARALGRPADGIVTALTVARTAQLDDLLADE